MIRDFVLMADGERLSVTLYLPANQPAPCILEALPYRKDDMTASWRPEYERFAAEFGLAVARVDVRGTGSSGGLATDEYPIAERSDLTEVIAWLAAQSWCTGNIGMFGTSYGGFNSFQLACERPAHLKAIVPIYATDDRFTDDVHQMGGARKWLDLVDYCHYMAPMNLLPPVPEIWGDTWRAEWLRRVAENEPWLFTWLAHPEDDSYWRQGSVRPDYERINIPTMIIAGWADGYRNTSFRTVAAVNAPTRLLAGPWAHAAPISSAPGPRIDHVAEMAAFFNEHLRGGETTWELPHTWFCRFSHAPDPVLDTVPGQWRSDSWPSSRSSERKITLADQPTYVVRPDVGMAAWISCAGHLPYGQPDDQRFDDAASITWDIEIAEPLEIAGSAHLQAHVTATCPHPIIAVRLCDVAPDGTSTLVSRGTLLIGPTGEVDVELEATAWQWQAGHALRVSVAGADWPNVVAPGGPGTLTLRGATLTLPIYESDPSLPVPAFIPGNAKSSEDTEGVIWQIERDVVNRITRCVVGSASTYDTPFGTASERYDGWVSVDTRTFEQRAHSDVKFTLRFPEVSATVHSIMDVVTAGETYEVTMDITVHDGLEVVAEQHWQRSFPRA